MCKSQEWANLLDRGSRQAKGQKKRSQTVSASELQLYLQAELSFCIHYPLKRLSVISNDCRPHVMLGAGDGTMRKASSLRLTSSQLEGKQIIALK